MKSVENLREMSVRLWRQLNVEYESRYKYFFVKDKRCKGGRGIKSSYGTKVMRIPLPIEQEVKNLIAKFFESVTTFDPSDKEVIESLDETEIVFLSHAKRPLAVLKLPLEIIKSLKKCQIRTIGALLVSMDSLDLPYDIDAEGIKQIEAAIQEYGDYIRSSTN